MHCICFGWSPLLEFRTDKAIGGPGRALSSVFEDKEHDNSGHIAVGKVPEGDSGKHGVFAQEIQELSGGMRGIPTHLFAMGNQHRSRCEGNPMTYRDENNASEILHVPTHRSHDIAILYNDYSVYFNAAGRQDFERVDSVGNVDARVRQRSRIGVSTFKKYENIGSLLDLDFDAFGNDDFGMRL